MIGVIVGGGLLAVVIVGALVFAMMRRRRAKKDAPVALQQSEYSQIVIPKDYDAGRVEISEYNVGRL
jgi:flagellar biosynthesis/type III secretory pathway M-ring protein FliF/YscJ